MDESYPGKICFQLPPIGALAGTVLQHCSSLLDRLLKSQKPVIFKVGITHNPLWRWGNQIYGYTTAKEKWSNMVVMYVAAEPHSVGMLEAALIDKYQSNPYL